MTKEKTAVHTKVHVSKNVNLSFKTRFNVYKKLFTDPKIYKYKEVENGEKIVSIKKPWHVYYYFRNPETGLMEKIMEKSGINRFKTIRAREAAAENLCRALKVYLQHGNNPFEKKKKETGVNSEIYTSVEALKIAFEHKKNSWKESTINVNKLYLDSFIKWLIKEKLDNKPIQSLTRKHVSFYLGELLNKLSNTSRNNHKKLLSSLFSELEEKEMVEHNFIPKIADLKSKAKKNKPFSHKQLDDILKYAKVNDPYLFAYIKVMWYSFLRPIEITRLKVKNINLSDGIIEIDSKTSTREYIRIVKPLQFYFNSLELNNFNDDMFLFTKEKKVGYWETVREKSREDWFTRRFKKIKDHFNLSEDYGIYSFRHTSALSIYYKFKKDGLSEYQSVLKVQEIMRHNDENTTRKYLREIGGELPEDWSNNYEYEIA